MADLISVIVPVYNAERFLERCLDSILIQTHQNLEIIVVNDGSTDGSANIIDRYAEKDSRIITIHQKNAGVSAARNAGLRAAKGTYIGFVDGDDEILPDMYEVLLNNLLAHNADISHCGFELVKPNTAIKFYGTGILLVQDHQQGIREILLGKRVEPSSCTKLFKKSVIKDLFFLEDLRFNEDLLFNILAFYRAKKTVFNDEMKYRYIQNAESASQSGFTEKMGQDVFAASQRIKQELKDEKIKSDVDYFYAGKLLTLLQAFEQNNLKNVPLYSEIKQEAERTNVARMGLRFQVTKLLLIRFPFLYGSFRWLYDALFSKRKKWTS